MEFRNKVGFACNALAAALAASFGVVYLLSTQFMPYHAQAIGRDWQDLDANLQVLLLAMIKVIGAGYLVGAVVMTMLLIIPWRRGDPWARWTVFVQGLGVSLYSAGAALFVERHTIARPPWEAAVIGGVLVTVGFFLAPKVPKEVSHPFA